MHNTRDNLNGSTQIAGRDLLFSVEFVRKKNGLPLKDCRVVFTLKRSNAVLLVLRSGVQMNVATNTEDNQVIAGRIPASVTANLPNGTSLFYDWAIEYSGDGLGIVQGDVEHQGSFRVRA